MEYHVTDGYWLIFEAEHHAISLGADGVRLWDSLQEAAPNSGELEDMSDAEYWVHPEHTLFVGEHIQDVQRSEHCWNILFDHFSMRLYPYDNTEQNDSCFRWLRRGNADCKPMHVGNHLLTRKCTCGGEGEIVIDFVHDYAVRCKKCHTSTWASMCLIDAILDWNAWEIPIQLDTGEEDLIAQLAKEPVSFIDVSTEGFWLAKASLCDAESVMVVFSDCAYNITSQCTADGNYDFSVSKYSSYNKNRFGMRITSWEGKDIHGLGFERDECGRYLRFEIDGSYLLLTPDAAGLMIGFTGWDPDGNPYDMNRSALFKGYEDA